MTLHANSQFAHFLYPAPRLLPRHADLFGDLFAADDDCRILRQQRQQGIDAPVGRSRQISHSLGSHRESGSILERGRGHKPTAPAAWVGGKCPVIVPTASWDAIFQKTANVFLANAPALQSGRELSAKSCMCITLHAHREARPGPLGHLIATAIDVVL